MKEKTIKQTKISREEIQEIALLIQSGASDKAIANLFDIDTKNIQSFKRQVSNL